MPVLQFMKFPLAMAECYPAFYIWQELLCMSLEFLDFRVLIMNILCLFQCPCLTRTALAFKSPLSELSGKWCSHAMGLPCIFSIFSPCAEIKCMLSLWQISVLQHNFGFWWYLFLHTELAGQKETKNSLSSGWHWPGRHSSSKCWSVGASLSFLVSLKL